MQKVPSFSSLHIPNIMVTVICEKQILGKIHQNPPYLHRRLSSAISNITEEIYGRCRYTVKFTKTEFSCLQQSFPPFSQRIPHCKVGGTRLLRMAFHQPLTLTWYRDSTAFLKNYPKRSPRENYNLNLSINATISLTQENLQLE